MSLKSDQLELGFSIYIIFILTDYPKDYDTINIALSILKGDVRKSL